MTDLLYLRDAQLRTVSATVTAVDADEDGRARVALDRTILYATGGGQPHDTGTLGGAAVVDVVQGRRRGLAHDRRTRPVGR